MSNRIAMPPGTEDMPSGFGKVATERYDPEGFIYQPPEGAPILSPPPEGVFYRVALPSQQTDKLQPYERRYVIPVAMSIAPIFGVVPIPDDVYRTAPEQSKLTNLFCIFSRSNIRKLSSGILEWDAVVVVIRKFCVVRVECHLHPGNNLFYIRRVYLWSNTSERYEVVEDPKDVKINPEVLPVILDQYATIEGILS